MSTKKTTKPEPEKHALLSASGAHIWLKCTAMPRAVEGVPDEGSPYAAEGTLAHAIGELKLRKALVEPMTKRSYDSQMNKLKKQEFYADEMQRYTDDYLDYVKGIAYAHKVKAHVAVEQKLDFSAIAPEGFGTGDCVIIGERILDIVDFKYGKGKMVPAYDNPQIKIYGLAALLLYAPFFPVDTVRMHIFQPRLDNFPVFEMTAADLMAWGETVKPIAQKAFYGFGQFVPSEECQFCNIAATCRARTDAAMLSIVSHLDADSEPPLPQPATLSNEEIGGILDDLAAIDAGSWIKKVQAYALGQCINGQPVPGWKAVEGRSNRAFTDFDKAVEALKAAGLNENLFYTRQPATLTDIETTVGKKDFATIAGPYVAKAPGKPTLAPETDKREPMHRETAAEDFEPVNQN